MFIWIYNPFSRNRNLNLMERIRKTTDQYRKLKKESMEYCPYPIFPEPDGIIAVGQTDNGDTVFWLSDSKDPDCWKILINKTRSNKFELHDENLTGFMAGLVKGVIKSDVVPRDFIDMTKPFLPFNQIRY